MVTGVEYFNAHLRAVTFPGAYYSQDPPNGRCFPENSPHGTDCSGSTSAALRYVGLGQNGCEGSFAQARRCYAAGTQMSVEEAFHTPGAWLFEGINNGRGGIPGQDPGHVGTSAGDGVHSVEARGHWAGVGVFRIDSLVWSGAGMPPGVTKDAALPGTPIPTPQPLPAYALEEDDEMITLPNNPNPNITPLGRTATARAVKNFNFVLLEDGADVAGSVRVAPNDPTRHWWAPQQKDLRPGYQIIGVTKDLSGKVLVARYGFPDGSTATYGTNIVGA